MDKNCHKSTGETHTDLLMMAYIMLCNDITVSKEKMDLTYVHQGSHSAIRYSSIGTYYSGIMHLYDNYHTTHFIYKSYVCR